MGFRLGTWATEPLLICLGLLRGSLLFPVIFNIYVANNVKILTSGIGQILSFAEEVLSYPIGSNI